MIIDRDFVTESSTSALKAAFNSWSLEECKSWLTDDIGIDLKLEEDSQKYFPVSDDAKEVRDKLVKACRQSGVEFLFDLSLHGMNYASADGTWACTFHVKTSGRTTEHVVSAKRVVLATGGKSFPNLGCTGDGYKMLRALGHILHEPYAALTPLLGNHPGPDRLSGLSLYDCQLSVSAGGKKGKTLAQRKSMVFTHRGYSGPAILDLSHHFTRNAERGIESPQLISQWVSKSRREWEDDLLSPTAGAGGLTVGGYLRRSGVPARLSHALCQEAGITAELKCSEIKKQNRQQLIEVLTRFRLVVTGDLGYAQAEVTGGGVPLNQINIGDMSSRKVPGIYLCGELCDLFGRIGGYNFLWAWYSGRLVGLGAARSVGRSDATLNPESISYRS